MEKSRLASAKIDHTKVRTKPNFADEAIKSSFTPGPGAYPVKANRNKILGSVGFKLDRVSYLDDAILHTKGRPSPGQYEPKVKLYL